MRYSTSSPKNERKRTPNVSIHIYKVISLIVNLIGKEKEKKTKVLSGQLLRGCMITIVSMSGSRLVLSLGVYRKTPILIFLRFFVSKTQTSLVLRI